MHEGGFLPKILTRVEQTAGHFFCCPLAHGPGDLGVVVIGPATLYKLFVASLWHHFSSNEPNSDKMVPRRSA